MTGHPAYSLPAADHGGEAEDEVALADVVADAVAVHDEGAEAHEGLGGAAHLMMEAGKFKSVKKAGHSLCDHASWLPVAMRANGEFPQS